LRATRSGRYWPSRFAQFEIVVAPDITAREAHQIVHNAEHALRHAIARLTAALVHAEPATSLSCSSSSSTR
jgi:divalent metal cation (Fe/Co/Zn/Cd) transporter